MTQPPPSYGAMVPWSSSGGATQSDDSETAPLTALGCQNCSARRGGRSILRSTLTLIVVILLSSLIIAQNAGLVATFADDVPASQKAAMRESWRQEQNDHQEEVVRWTGEREAHEQELRLWEIEREMRERDRAVWKEQIEAERKQWWRTVKREREAWKKEVEAERRDWWAKENGERAKWKQEVEAEKRAWWAKERNEREKWHQEAEAERRAWWDKEHARRDEWRKEEAADRERWARDEEEWARRGEEEERHRKEIEHRRQGVWWSVPWKNKGCYASGIMSYSAQLFDIPGDLDWLDVCMDMPIQIEGRWFDKPDKCERDDKYSKVWATWMVEEPRCALYWDRLHNIGCSHGQSGMRRYIARLMNLHKGDDWDKMCSTTPANILGLHYDHPTVCVIEDNGRTGIWDYPDPSCH